jgi:hypothetical protein
MRETYKLFHIFVRLLLDGAYVPAAFIRSKKGEICLLFNVL